MINQNEELEANLKTDMDRDVALAIYLMRNFHAYKPSRRKEILNDTAKLLYRLEGKSIPV